MLHIPPLVVALWRDETNLDFQWRKNMLLIKSVLIISLLPTVQYNMWSKLTLQNPIIIARTCIGDQCLDNLSEKGSLNSAEMLAS